MEPRAKSKIIRLNFKDNKEKSPVISIIGDKDPELRLAVSEKNFLSIRENGISMSPGIGKSFNLQGMSHNMVYGGLLQDLPFPLSIMPTTTFNPFPKQMIKVPFVGLMKNMFQLIKLGSAMTGV